MKWFIENTTTPQSVPHNHTYHTDHTNHNNHSQPHRPHLQPHRPQVAVPDLFKACVGSDILLFVIPQQFVANICKQLRYRIKKTALAVTMIKVLWERSLNYISIYLILNKIKKDLKMINNKSFRKIKQKY